MKATQNTPEVKTTTDSLTNQIPEDEKLKQEILDLKITGIKNTSDITPELLGKYKSWRKTNEQLDALKLGSSLSLAQFEEKLENSKDTLPGTETPTVQATVSEAVDAVTTDIKQAIADTPDAVADWAAQKASEKVQEKLSGLPFGMGEKLSGAFGNLSDIIKKVFVALTGAFGGLGFTSWLKTKFGWETPKVPEVPVANAGVPEVAAAAENTETGKQSTDVISFESKQAAYYKSGAHLILRLAGGLDSTNNSGSDHILTGLKKIPFGEIFSLSEEQKRGLLKNPDNLSERSLLDEIIAKLHDDPTQKLLGIGFSQSSLSNILSPNGKINASLYLYFGETPELGKARIEEILSQNTNGTLDWKSLSFGEISMLYISSIPALRIPVGNALGDMFHGIGDFFGEVQSEVLEDNMYIIPPHIIKGFGSLGVDGLNKNTYIPAHNDAEVQTKVLGENPSAEDTETMQRIFEMKAYLLGEFSSIKKLKLSPEQQELFKNNLDYAGVLGLYSILGGVPNIESINPISFPIVLYTISRIIGTGDGKQSYQGSLYLGNYVREILLSGKGDGLSDDELFVLNMYGKTALDVMFLSHMDNLLKTFGVAEGLSGIDMTTLGIGTTVGGFSLYTLGKWQIAKGIRAERLSFFGAFLKKLGLIGMFAGVAMGATGYVLKEGENKFVDDSLKAIEKGDAEKLKQLMQEQTDSLKKIQVGDKEVTISAFEGQKPYIVMDEKIYSFNIGERSFWESTKSSFSSLLSGDYEAALTLIARQIPFGEHTGTIGEVDFNTQVIQGENIVFGNGEHTQTIRLDDVLKQLTSGKGEMVGESVINKLSESIKMDFGRGKLGFPIAVLDENYILYLAEEGPIGDILKPTPTE